MKFLTLCIKNRRRCGLCSIAVAADKDVVGSSALQPCQQPPLSGPKSGSSLFLLPRCDQIDIQLCDLALTRRIRHRIPRRPKSEDGQEK
ncbi:hypothetical protein [Rhizobium leguminosarum]|uniref:hypothetical protein n=1 Tax=Rhizobium leguminosarum TaxID=384 RepID=UPI003CFC042B